MKKTGKYMFGMLLLGLMFAGSYYLSYRQALRRLSENRQEQNMNYVLAEHIPAEEQFAALNGPLTAAPTAPPVPENITGMGGQKDSALTGKANDTVSKQTQGASTPEVTQSPMALGEDALETDTIRKAYVLPDTKIILETYEKASGEFLVEETVPDAVLVGMTREQVEAELQKELKDMPVSEYEKGLVSNELITFSEDKVIIRRTYDRERLEYLYYIAVKGGEVVVYYSDHKTVYEYTGIQAVELTEEIRVALMAGIPVQTTEELFSMLESFSS